MKQGLISELRNKSHPNTVNISTVVFVCKSICIFCLLTPCAFADTPAEISESGAYLLSFCEQSNASNYCPPVNAQSRILECQCYYQTTSYTCGPASAMTLMNYFGKLKNSEMNHNTEMKIAREMDTDAVPGGGTTPFQVQLWLMNHGLHVESGETVSADMIISDLEKGVPVLVFYDNHWILAKGFLKGPIPDEDKIIFSDPFTGDRIIKRSEFNKNDSTLINTCNSNFSYYIVATKK